MPPITLRAPVPPLSTRLDSFSIPAMRPVVGRWPSTRCRSFLRVGIVAVALAGGGLARAEPVASTPPSGAVGIDRFAAFVTEASQRFGIPAAWIRAVMRIESAGDTHARSPKGAMGLMQLMPQTWANLRFRYGLGDDPYDPRDNIMAGAGYLRALHDRYGVPGFLAAYNAGPARYENHLATGRPLPAETRAYVAVVAPLIGGRASGGVMITTEMARPWVDAPLFVAHASGAPPLSDPPALSSSDRATEGRTPATPQSAGLFAGFSTAGTRP